MKLEEIGEFGFIDRIRRNCLIRPENVIKAIGDDAAVIRTEPDRLMLLTTDMLLERVHFGRTDISAFNLGCKALAVNLSDIAAMGGEASDAFVSIGIPESVELEFLEEVYRGIKQTAAEFRVNILGGDTTGSKADLVINVVVTGYVTADEVLLRSGAQIGDIVFSTGCLGDSRAGLHLLQNRTFREREEFVDLLHAHWLPRPHLKEGRFLATQPRVHAAIDVSDGLSADLGHIIHESAAGARIYADRLPISERLQAFCSRFGYDPIEYAVSGGEDYTLLCTVAPEQAEDIAAQYCRRFNRPLFAVGEITDSGRIELVDAAGRVSPVESTGWNHFRT
jgi:thiamine-monophosphate kinase